VSQKKKDFVISVCSSSCNCIILSR